MKLKKIIWWSFVIIVILIAGGIYQNSYKRANAPEENLSILTREYVKTILTEVNNEESVLLDVRTDKERREDGYIEEAIHFDLLRLEAGEFPNIAKNTHIYTYCKGGIRAGKAEKILENAGWETVTNIGGLSDWISAGGDVAIP